MNIEQIKMAHVISLSPFWAWLPGMRWHLYVDVYDEDGEQEYEYGRLDDYQREGMYVPPDAVPDLLDVTTHFCLYALLRRWDPWFTMIPNFAEDSEHKWMSISPSHQICVNGYTELDALVMMFDAATKWQEAIEASTLTAGT